ncbi:MAG: toll/interleukin-1 receptor domain-containing protein [Promethearchaeota archaeon]
MKTSSWDVFISYSHKDSKMVIPFANHISKVCKKNNISVYFDRTARPTEDRDGLSMGLSEGLATCNVFIFCLTQNYFESAWCNDEFIAFYKRMRHKGITDSTMEKGASSLLLIPVLIDSTYKSEITSNLAFIQLMLFEKFGTMKAFDQLPISKAFFRMNKMNFRELADHVAEYILSNIKKKITDELIEPATLWKALWQLYQHSTIGEKIDVEKLLEMFNPPTKFSRNMRNTISEYSDRDMITLYEAIAKSSSYYKSFDRYYAKAQDLEGVSSTNMGLQLFSHEGSPIAALVGLVRNRSMLSVLQYSYYAYIQDEGRDKLVDVAAIAGLAMNIHSWHEMISDIDDIKELVVDPLSKGKDIGRILSW